MVKGSSSREVYLYVLSWSLVYRGRLTENKSNRIWRIGGFGKVSFIRVEINKGRIVKERLG